MADSSMVGLLGITHNKALLFAGSMLVFLQICSTVYYKVGVYICCCNKESLLDRFCFQATDWIPALVAVVIADPGGFECMLLLFTTTLGNAERCWKLVWNLEHKLPAVQ
jgi:hypothetical protein